MKPNEIFPKRSWMVCLIILLTSLQYTYGQNGGKASRIDSTAIHQAHQSKMLLLQAAGTTDGGMQVMAASVTLPTSYNYYVATTGSDSNAGTQAAPLLTIQAAINKSVTGQAIKVADGRYVECIDFMGKSIKLVGNPNSPESVIIDGNRQNATVQMTRRETSSAMLCGFTITGGSGHLVYLQCGGGIHLYNNANPVLSDLIITGNQSNSGAALGALHSATPVIQNTLVYGNTSLSANYPVRFHNLISGAAMYNVTIVDNPGGYGGVGVTRGCSVTIKNSIIRNPGLTCEVRMSSDNGSANTTTINYCNIRGGTGLLHAVAGQGTYSLGSGIIDVNPGFVDATAGKYQLAAGSPCIDAGDPSTTWNDVNLPPSRGTARNDLGMYGWQVSAQPYQAGGATPPDEDDKPAVTISPSSNRNYIHTIIPQVEVTSIPTGARSPSQYMETIEYFDGLGRHMQTVAVGASPDGKDIVTPVEYDAFGREAVKYLPYESESNNGSYKANALGTTTTNDSQRKWYNTAHTGIPSDMRPFSETIFEPSPLSRVMEQYGPGQAWKTGSNNKPQEISYGSNTATEVRLWVASASQVATPKPYDANTLYKTETTDEDGRVTITYTDLQERVVRQRQVGSGGNVDTDYAYDDFGRLAYVIPPAVPKSANLTIDTIKADPWFSKYVYAYIYDARGRVIKKHIPGAGWTHIIYNKLDQPVLAQDARQRETGQWSYTKYDAHGRTVISGLYSSSDSFETLQAAVDNAAQWESRGTVEHGYTRDAFPTSGGTPLAVNYYDNYDFPDNPFEGTSDRPHGLPTGSKVKVLESSPEVWLYNASYYNQKGRVKLILSEQFMSGDSKVTDRTEFEYDFMGRIKKTKRSIAKNSDE